MGNDYEQNSNSSEDYIPFEAIQESLGITDLFLFKKYLQEVFVDLSSKINNSKNKILSRITFYDYIKLPIFISEKLYNSFSYENKEGLTENEFVEGFFYLYSGTFQETAKIIFNILDFDKDGIIHKEDVKIILSYLPLNDMNESIDKNNNSLKNIFRNQMKSLEEIDDLLNLTFDKYEDEMNFEQYLDIIQNEKSDVYLQIILFLYQKKPFNNTNIECLKLKYKEKNDEEYKQKMRYYNRKRTKGGTIKIKSPNQMSLLSPTITFLKRKFSLNELNINEKINNQKRMSSKNASINNIKDSLNKDINLKQSNLTNKSSGISTQSESDIQIPENAEIKNLGNNLFRNNKNISFVRYNNEVELEKNVKENHKDIKEILDKSKQRFSSPTKYLQEKTTLDNLALKNKNKNFETNLVTINEEKNDDGDKKEEDSSDIIEEKKNIKYENWVYKLTENKNLKKFYLVLLNKDLYYYKDKEKQKFLGMHNLSGCFLQEQEKVESIILDNKNFYIFEINFHNKSKIRKYYTPDINILINFLKAIKEAIGYIKFTDHYELKEVIGKGKFGVVNLGIHKKTQKQVAIKIINKDSIKTLEDKALVKIEIDILKLCHHQNIVRLLDHLENLDYIYIIMEYIEGGTLGQYIKKNNFNFTEHQAANMLYQIALGVKYLHSYGIVHRDLKPDNIMITHPNDLGILKIMDFGLSKILSSQEKMVDGFGTLSYVAPEVLLRSPYNKEVDIWSLGVILYYILSGHLPFKGNKEIIIAEKIVNDELEFDDEEWELRSQKVKDLISNCLKKDPGERITIDEFLNHPWFKKIKKQKFSI